MPGTIPLSLILLGLWPFPAEGFFPQLFKPHCPTGPSEPEASLSPNPVLWSHSCSPSASPQPGLQEPELPSGGQHPSPVRSCRPSLCQGHPHTRGQRASPTQSSGRETDALFSLSGERHGKTPGWCCSVGRVLAWGLKALEFDS